MPWRSRADDQALSPVENGTYAACRDAPTSGRQAIAPLGTDPMVGRADALASRRCAAQVAAALEKLGYGVALIPAAAKPKRSANKK